MSSSAALPTTIDMRITIDMFVHATVIIVKFRNMEYFTLSGEEITGAASEIDPRLYYYSSYPELFLVDPTYCVQDG